VVAERACHHFETGLVVEFELGAQFLDDSNEGISFHRESDVCVLG